MGSWQRFRQAGNARLFRIDTDPSMHRDLWRIFRAIEMSPDNRSPYFIFDTAFSNSNEFFRTIMQRMATDCALLWEGLAADGVQLGKVQFALDAGKPPAKAFAEIVEAVWQQTKVQFDYLVLIFLPERIDDKAEWTITLEQLTILFASSKVRIAAADTAEGLLVPLCSTLPKKAFSGKFFIASNTLQEYLFKIAAGGWGALSKSDGAAPNSSIPSTQSNGTAAQSVPGVLSPDEAAGLRTCMAQAATASDEHDVDNSLKALRDARTICQRNALYTHEGIIVMAMANTLVAAEQNHEAIRHYAEAANLGTAAAAAVVVMQARLGEAATWFRIQEYNRAASTYQQAAVDATAAESEVMRIEALRMAGTCYSIDGRFTETVACWSKALEGAGSISPSELNASTITQLGQDFIALCEKHSLMEQAKSVARQLDSIKQQALLREQEPVDVAVTS